MTNADLYVSVCECVHKIFSSHRSGSVWIQKLWRVGLLGGWPPRAAVKASTITKGWIESADSTSWFLAQLVFQKYLNLQVFKFLLTFSLHQDRFQICPNGPIYLHKKEMGKWRPIFRHGVWDVWETTIECHTSTPQSWAMTLFFRKKYAVEWLDANFHKQIYI